MIDRVVAASSIGGVSVLDVHSDIDHNRTVVTLVGSKSRLIESALRMAAEAKSLIDMTKHDGVHPAMGAMDVVPFTSISGGSLNQSIDAANICGRRIADELGIPVFFYEFAALRRHATALTLPQVRKNAFENLAPDFGPDSPHRSAGSVCVGARKRLIAFNIELKTNDLDKAKSIAASVRKETNLIRGVRALAFPLASRNTVQISMNLTEMEHAVMESAFNFVSDAASRARTTIVGAELVGLAPGDSYGQLTAEFLGDPNKKQLEDAIADYIRRAES